MLYTFIKYLVKLGLLVFFRKIIVTKKHILHEKGPLLLACNHPNSFLDALLLGSYFRQPIHFLARGDAFKHPLAKKILLALKAIPIYRLSEGKEHLSLNDTTFERCTDILANGGIVLIFSEGLCLNQWQLRSLKKGTARIALNVWKQQPVSNALRILPVCLNYSSFTDFRKVVIIDFGKPIFYNEIPAEKNEAEQIVMLNKLLYARLQRGILLEKDHPEIIRCLLSNFHPVKKNEQNSIEILEKKQTLLLNFRQEAFFSKLKNIKNFPLNKTGLLLNFILIILLLIPALAGLIIHFPFYRPLNQLIKHKTRGTVFYHSALFGVLIITYPVYILLLSIILAIVFHNLFLLGGIIVMPLLSLICLKWKDCFESLLNYLKFVKEEITKIQQVLQG